MSNHYYRYVKPHQNTDYVVYRWSRMYRVFQQETIPLFGRPPWFHIPDKEFWDCRLNTMLEF